MVLSNVSFLVTSDYMESALLGFNVMKKRLQDDQQKDSLVNIPTKPFGKSPKVQAIFKSIQQKNQEEPIYTKKCMKVPAKTSITMSCKANLGMLDQNVNNLHYRHRLFT